MQRLTTNVVEPDRGRLNLARRGSRVVMYAAFADAEKSFPLKKRASLMLLSFFMEQANRLKATGVAVGHTAADQVETVIMHFIRGRGLAGLRE